MTSLRNQHILITAGPTWEMQDPVRFLSNRSSGKMGFELAKAAQRAGARVTLVTGPVALADPPGIKVIRVVSACEMYRECLKHFPKTVIAIMTAAVSDYRPMKVARHKLKKCLDQAGAGMTIELVRNPDILATLGRLKRRRKNRSKHRQIVVGFALESRNLLHYAREKLHRKNCDLIVANAVPALGNATSSATIVYKDGRIQKLPNIRKSALARHLLRAISLS